MMKKIIPILMTLIVFASCGSDDNILDQPLKLERKGSIYHRTSLNDNGNYDNAFSATFSNPNNNDITGHVKFTIKEYGTFNSESGVVPAGNNIEKTFFLSLETEKIIDESYLLNAEFVRE